MGDVVIIYVEEEKEVDLKSCSSPISLCRICHEEEFGSSKKLESPCACSGTVKVTTPTQLTHSFLLLLLLFSGYVFTD